MKNIALILYCLSFILQTGLAQLTPDFLLAIHIEDARGNIDTFWYGYDSRARYDTINSKLGEELILTPMDSILGIIGYHGGDKRDKKYPSKTIIAHIEGQSCPFTEDIHLFVHAKYPPITLKWDNQHFPVECHDYRSEIISKDALPQVVQHWATESHNYTCMSFEDSLIEDFAFRDTIPWGVKDEFIIEGGQKVTVHGYLIIGLGFSECKQLVNTSDIVIDELKVLNNPIKEELVIEGLSNLKDLKYWEIYNSDGRVIKTQNTWNGSYNILDLSTGQYFFIAYTNKGYSFAKFMKL